MNAPSLTTALLALLPARLVSAAATPVVDFWSWATASVPAGALINGLGLGSLAVLFATDRVLTKGQHLRRVADIERGYKERLVDVDTAYKARIIEIETNRDLVVSNLAKSHEARVNDLIAERVRDEARYQGTIARILGERDYERSAKDTERGRADALTTQVVDLAQEFGQTTVHLLKALDQAAE